MKASFAAFVEQRVDASRKALDSVDMRRKWKNYADLNKFTCPLAVLICESLTFYGASSAKTRPVRVASTSTTSTPNSNSVSSFVPEASRPASLLPICPYPDDSGCACVVVPWLRYVLYISKYRIDGTISHVAAGSAENRRWRKGVGEVPSTVARKVLVPC